MTFSSIVKILPKKVVVLLEITAPHSVADPGEGPAPLIYRPNWGPKRDRPPPPYLRVWSLIPSTKMIQLTLTVKMTTAQVVETSVTVNNSSPIQNYVHGRRSSSTYLWNDSWGSNLSERVLIIRSCWLWLKPSLSLDNVICSYCSYTNRFVQFKVEV